MTAAPDAEPPLPPLYVADTNVYVTAANDPAFRERFETFVQEHGPLGVSALVVAEVVIGIADAASHAAAASAMSAGTTLVAPTADDWLKAGSTIARLGGAAVTKSRSFWNDALLAAQCARLGATLVTRNTADFERLARHIPVRAVSPFPLASSA